MSVSGCHQFHVPCHTNGRNRKAFASFLAMNDFITNDATQRSIDLLIIIAVADPTKVKIRTVADVNLVFIGPANKTMILIGNLHDII